MGLSPKQKSFINEYLTDFNATRAAQRAGYKGDDATLASIGWENLRKPEIEKAISQRLSEQAMTADEVLNRLAAIARGNMNDFVRFDDNGNPTFDLQAASQFGKLNLAKKLKIKTRTYNEPVGDDKEPIVITETMTEFELYDAQAALVQIGKHHKLFVNGPTGDEDDPIHIKVIEGPKDIR